MSLLKRRHDYDVIRLEMRFVLRPFGSNAVRKHDQEAGIRKTILIIAIGKSMIYILRDS